MEYKVFDALVNKVEELDTLQTETMREQGFKIKYRDCQLGCMFPSGINVFYKGENIAIIEHGHYAGVLSHEMHTDYEKYKHCESLMDFLQYCLKEHINFQKRLEKREKEIAKRERIEARDREIRLNHFMAD